MLNPRNRRTPLGKSAEIEAGASIALGTPEGPTAEEAEKEDSR